MYVWLYYTGFYSFCVLYGGCSEISFITLSFITKSTNLTRRKSVFSVYSVFFYHRDNYFLVKTSKLTLKVTLLKFIVNPCYQYQIIAYSVKIFKTIVIKIKWILIFGFTWPNSLPLLLIKLYRVFRELLFMFRTSWISLS